MVITMRFIGGAIGFTIYNAIFTDKLTTALPATIAEYAIQAGLDPAEATTFVTAAISDPAAAQAMPGVTPDILAAATLGTRWAYANSLPYVWYSSIPFGVVTVIVCLFLPDVRKYMTSRVAARIEH